MTTLYIGDAREVLATLPSESIHCVVTSPPYWGLRDYGVDGQFGLEPTPEAYVASMVAVFREVKRVLRKDGTLWLNLADSYAGGGGFSPNAPSNRAGSKQTTQKGAKPGGLPVTSGLKAKDLVGIPWRVAFALQADGWYLRSDVIWHKPNVMPENVRDRPTRSHEYVFLLTKSARYFYDAAAIEEPALPGNERPTRNRRTVWSIPTKPYSGAHFSTFPVALAVPCIQAGSPRDGTILDPFAGSGTVGAAALANGRKSILIELNPDYAPLILKRVGETDLAPT